MLSIFSLFFTWGVCRLFNLTPELTGMIMLLSIIGGVSRKVDDLETATKKREAKAKSRIELLASRNDNDEDISG